MINNEKLSDFVVRGHRPTTDVDRNFPPAGGSVVTKQLRTIREATKRTSRAASIKKSESQ